MEFISLPRSSLGSRWRPVGAQGAAPAWRPAHASSMAALQALPHRGLGQLHPLAIADAGVSVATSLGASMVGFAMALWGPKDAPTWRWIGGLVGSIGVLRVLHDVSKW